MPFLVRLIIYLLLLLQFGTQAFAAPSGKELLAACEQSLEDGFDGIAGQMCTWYVTPCDCDYGNKPDMPRVCLPASVPVEMLARDVVDGLSDQPGLQQKDADIATALILSRTYPCND
jgi:hypothetical protein